MSSDYDNQAYIKNKIRQKYMELWTKEKTKENAKNNAIKKYYQKKAIEKYYRSKAIENSPINQIFKDLLFVGGFPEHGSSLILYLASVFYGNNMLVK